MKKIFCLFLAFVITVCSIFAVDFTVFADDIRFGPDISEHNGDFDIAARKEKGESFVMIRLGWYNHLDKYFMENIKKAAEAEMNFGVYLYSYAYSSKEAQIEADFVIETLKNLPEEYLEYMTLPVAYDLEDKLIISNLTDKFGKSKLKSQITEQMTIFCDAIRDSGYTPMVYANLNWFTNYIDIKTAVDNNYKIWYAYWLNEVPTEFPSSRNIGNTGYYADMWQYAVTKEVIGELDKNVMYSTMGCETHTYKVTKKNTAKATKSKAGTTEGTFSVCENCGYQYSTGAKVINPVTSFTLSTTSYTYNGEQRTPSVTVMDSKGKKLVKDTDYKVTYDDGRKKIGKYKVTVTLMGNYSGSKTLYFTINPKITLSTTSYTYNGKVKKPTVTVKDKNGKKISTKNYTIKYEKGRKNVGKYKVTIKFINGHSGTYTKYFTVKPAKTSISSITSAKKAFTVKWKKKTTQVTGYQIQYSTSSKFSSKKTKTVTKNSTTSKKITGLKAKKKYYVRVRTYKTVSGTKYYSDWSAVKTVKTK